MLIGASLLLVGVVLLVMTHDLRYDDPRPGESGTVGRARPETFWWVGVILVTVGGALAVSSLLLI